jgi:endonuclease-3
VLGYIKQLGLAPTKSKNLVKLSQKLLDDFDGEVPNTIAAMETLPGIGHKTASVVAAQAFGIPAMPVDTHIHRLAARWGLSSGKNVKTTEKDLKALFPRETWNALHLQIIFFGREHCPALHHDLSTCPICSWAATRKRIAEEAAHRARGRRKR